MPSRRSFDLIFIGSCVALAILACAAIAWMLIETTRWYLNNCPASTNCASAKWMIDYWWLLFLPVCLLSAWALRKVYDNHTKQQSGADRPDA